MKIYTKTKSKIPLDVDIILGLGPHELNLEATEEQGRFLYTVGIIQPVLYIKCWVTKSY